MKSPFIVAHRYIHHIICSSIYVREVFWNIPGAIGIVAVIPSLEDKDKDHIVGLALLEAEYRNVMSHHNNYTKERVESFLIGIVQ